MTLYAYAASTVDAAGIPFVTVNISLKDANNALIDVSTMDITTLSFDIAGNQTSGLTLFDGSTSGLESTALTGLLSAVKTWAENADWNTGIDWASSYGVATPVSFDSISMVQAQTGVTLTDVTPA